MSALTPGHHMSASTYDPPCAPRLPAEMISHQKIALSASVRPRNVASPALWSSAYACIPFSPKAQFLSLRTQSCGTDIRNGSPVLAKSSRSNDWSGLNMAHLRAWLSGVLLASCALSYEASAQQKGVTRMGLDSLR